MSTFLIKEAKHEVIKARKDFKEAEALMSQTLKDGEIVEMQAAADFLVEAADRLRNAIEDFAEACEVA